MGGEHATYHAEAILAKHCSVDAVILGEGEETFLELVSRYMRFIENSVQQLQSSEVSSLNRNALVSEKDPIFGAIVRGDNGRLIDGGFQLAIEDLDSIPEPSKDSIELALLASKPVTLSILTGRGCYHNCRFCTAHTFMRLGGGKVWRRRSPKKVVHEMETLSIRYLSHKLVHPIIQFQDVIFLGTSKTSKKWIMTFITELKNRNLNIPFYCMARADAIIANEYLIPSLIDVGLCSVEMGIESGVDRILRMYNKRNTSIDNKQAIRILRENGITYEASGFIMFDPRMSLKELKENAKYLTQFGASTWDFFVNKLQLYPGTAIRNEMINNGLFNDANEIGITSGYNFVDPKVGDVAEYAYYYDLSIRKLDLLLRDIKALIARDVRSSYQPNQLLLDAVNLVHNLYLQHFLSLIEHAEKGNLAIKSSLLISSFIKKVYKLIGLLSYIISISPKENSLDNSIESEVST